MEVAVSYGSPLVERSRGDGVSLPMDLVHARLALVSWKDVGFTLLGALEQVAEILPDVVEEETWVG